jgi:hypothetical protein
MAYTTVDNPELYFQTKLYTGNGSTQSITLDGDENMQPDFVWVKDRGRSGYNHVLNDSVRGVTKYIRSNLSNTEATLSDAITSFDSDGFTLGSDSSNGEHNVSSQTYVSWNWKASGSTSSDSNGSITSTISANTTAGFSIVTWTGNGSSGATIGHGLGVKPRMIISKRRDSTSQWTVYEAINGATKYMTLNQTDATSSATSRWNDTEPTASVFSVGNSAEVNGSGGTYIAYCFADIKGYQKIGSYKGNGNADGAFAYTGFRPAWIMIKKSSGTENWSMYDAKRNTNGDSDTLPLNADNNSNENGNTGKNMDILSNGVKMKTSNGELNGSGDTYIYMAFAESPFVNSNGVPNNAR